MSNDGRGGKPVGRVASDRSRRGYVPTRSSRWGSWSAALPLIILALVVGLGGGTAIGWFIGHGSQQAASTTTGAVTTTEATGTTADAGAAYGVVTVTGEALPVFQNGTADTAVGLTIPEIDGTDFEGNEYTITANGSPKLILAVAHWCPYCQQALPVYSEWYASSELPADLEVFMLTVFTTPDRGNYPPGPWLVAEDWRGPILADDAAGSMARALGIASVPYSLLVAADGTVASRTSGSLSAEQLDAAVEYVTGL